MASDNLPKPESMDQILGEALSAYAAKQGINDFNVGSAVVSFFEVVALLVARSSGDIFQILRDFSVDRATGEALQRLAIENSITPITAKPSTGYVTVTDTSFEKISTKIYAGLTPPNIGSTVINVSDASLFPASGAIYIGRGTPNVEGPLSYTTAPVQSGNYWTITLTTGTTKFHNLSESVILSQGGNRSIPVNTIVVSPAIGASPDIQYSVTSSAVVLDGETSVSNVPISALLPGADGNVPIGAISKFAVPPFPDASVMNSLPLNTGRDNETDDELRVRIKRKLASTGLGTSTAVESSVLGATPSDENATIVSTNMIQTSVGAILYADNGSGYEAKTSGVGIESIIDSALGGEQFFQLSTGGRQAPVAKAFLQSTLSAPFDLIGGDTLAITVGSQTYEHTFLSSDFRSPGSVTAYEIITSVNANTSLGFEATTFGGGQYVVFRSKSEGNDSIQIAIPTVSGRDASVQLGLPSGKIETLRLYKNKVPLSKDGNNATVFSQAQSLWSPTILTGDTLILSVDGTDHITYVINDSDFIATGLYTSVNSSNSLESWVTVLNKKLTGVTVSIVGQQLSMSSNLGASNRAAIDISSSSTLVSKGMFTSVLGLSSQGKASDYILDRNTAQFELIVPLSAGDQLAAGTTQTEARIQSASIASGSITFSTDAYIWLLADAPGTLISTGVAGSTLLGVQTPSANTIRYTSNVANAFTNVNIGDYFIVWSPDLAAGNRVEGRVKAATATTVDVLITSTEYASVSPVAGVLFTQGLVVLRSEYAPQKFKVSSGTWTLDQIAIELQSQTQSIIFTVEQEEFLVVRSRTKDSSGSLLIVSADVQGQLLSLPVGQSDVSKDSLIAFYDSGEFQAQLPLFIHSKFASGSAASPPDTFLSSVTSAISLSGRDPNELISFLHPYGSVRDAQPYGESVQESSIAGTLIGLSSSALVRRVRVNDRYFLANPLDFGSSDTVVCIVDNDATTGSFEIPLYRKAVTNTTLAVNSLNFNAYDIASGAGASFVDSFASFNFSNFKALMRAKRVLKPTPTETALLFRATKWGRSGEKINIGYTYPSAANLDVGSVISVGEDVQILINLKSDIPVATSIDSSTTWNVSVTPNTPTAGIDQVTFSYSGTGTAPSLSLVGGEYVNITGQTEFNKANIGIFRVSTAIGFTPTGISFSVQMPNGTAVSETAKQTLVNGAISFYQASNTTAADINTYVNANLSDYITSTIVNDGSLLGVGIIDLSTYEDSGFAYSTVQLKDGINWIASSNLSGSPQFIFKNSLTYNADGPLNAWYAFNNGEEVRLIPTTMEQVKRFISVLAVSGLTTLGSVGLVDRGSKLEIATDTLGSEGSIQIIGGLGNLYQVPVLDSASRVNNSLMNISVSAVSGQGIHSDQWFRLQATNTQKKETLFSSNTSITIESNTPVAGQSIIKMLNRSLNQRYFGKPRHHVRSLTRTFKIEKQGSLVCLSWDANGSSPAFQKPLNLNDSSGGTLNVEVISGSSDAHYVILTGNANFNEVSIGDLITISGMVNSVNDGTFLVTGVSDDGRILRVLNPNAADQFSHGTFTLTTNPSVGGTFTIGTNNLIAGTHFAIGVTPADTATNLSAVIGTLSGVTASANSNIVTVTATSASANIAISYSGGGTIVVSGAFLVGDSFVSGDFSCDSQVSEGDTLIIPSESADLNSPYLSSIFSTPFNILNQGKFKVVRRFGDSVWFENSNAVEEEVNLASNIIDLNFGVNNVDLKINASNHTMYVNWNGTTGVGYSEPLFGNAVVGDVVTFGSSFASANQGQFMVLRSGAKLQQIVYSTMPAGGQFSNTGAGAYFDVNSAGDLNQYRIWFNVITGGSNTPPASGGRTLVQVDINSTLTPDTAAGVASLTAIQINLLTGITATASNGVLTITTTGHIETTSPSNGTMPAPFNIQVSQYGRRTFLECVNPSAVSESSVIIGSGMFQCHRPQMQFLEYEASVDGDVLNLTSVNLGSANIGSYSIVRVLDRDSIIIAPALSAATNISLNGIETSVYVVEQSPYFGYKHAVFSSSQPGAPSRNLIVFDTNDQVDKINEAAGVELTSLNKLNFNTIIKSGLDSYRYNTGLIAEANRIIYGDPRDPETYPGVGAAGATIFVREPLARRIQVGLTVRLNTGVPFAQTSEQIRNAVSSLINSNDVGSSIAISSIVSAASAIPGVLAVSVSNPTFSTSNDLIILAPGEKALIIDPTLDISISQQGV